MFSLFAALGLSPEELFFATKARSTSCTHVAIASAELHEITATSQDASKSKVFMILRPYLVFWSPVPAISDPSLCVKDFDMAPTLAKDT